VVSGILLIICALLFNGVYKSSAESSRKEIL
jgi:hypothetical protein